MSRARLLIVWPLIAGLLPACGSAEDSAQGGLPHYAVPGCETLSSAACDVRSPDCQARLFEMAACLRGQAAGEIPPVTVMTEAEYAIVETARLAQEPARPSPDHYEIALGLFGLVQPGAFSPQTRVTENVTAWGVYRWDFKDVVVIDHGQTFDDETASPVLVHEFIHALQDRDVGLMALEAAATSYDAFLATDAVIEGEATLHAARFSVAMLGLDPAKVDWTEHFQNRLDRDERALLAEASPYTATLRHFPYSWGGRYLHFVWAAGGMNAVLDRFVTPPAATLAFLASTSSAVEPDLPPVEIAAPVPPPEWTRITQTQFGAWDFFLLLAKALPADLSQARSLALAWRADQLSVYASTDPAASMTAIVWQLAFDDDVHATAAAEALGKLLVPSAVSQEANRVVLAKTDSALLPLDWAHEM